MARQSPMTDVGSVISSIIKRRFTGAFSLIEVLMVVLIIAIMAAVAVPQLASDEGTRLRAAAQIVMADLAFAQVESISHSDDLRVVVFDTVNHGYSIATVSDTGTPVANPIGGQPYSVLFGTGSASGAKGVTIQSVTVGGDDILGFGAYGELDQTTAATIVLASGGLTVTITVDAVTGETTIGTIG